ncbi:hypothetical protein ACS0TY_006154 [Phlomoides rotata]
MDQKSWLWKKRSTEKTLVADKATNSLSKNEEVTEVQKLVIEDLGKFRGQVDAELKALLMRVESTEKENATLKYEVRVLEKQLDIRSEEREFNRRSEIKKENELRTLSYRNMGASDMNLMDDFAEMEKLAVVSVDNAIILTSSANRNISNSVHKVLELLEGINIQSQDNGVSEFSSGKDGEILSYRNSENPTGYIVRVFQWKAAELSAILQQFVSICNDLLNGKADVEQFVQQVASNLEWVINHCFSIQDVSSMKDAIRSHLYWDESGSESEVDSESECNKLCVQTDDVPYPGTEGKIWNVEWGDKESSSTESEIVKIHPQESKDIDENLDSEMETREEISDQVEKQKMIKEGLTETNHEWRKACERISHLENELENRSHFCRRLEETCHDLEIQIRSMTSKDVSDDGKQRERQLQSDLEITAASEKLAECQETILNLGKQLKALASPNDAALFDKVITKTANSVGTTLPTPTKNISRRSSLLNKMLAEDNNPHGSSHTSKENENGERFSSVGTNAATENSVKSINSERFDQEEKTRTSVASMDIVPCKKNGSRSFFKKLFWPQKKGKHLRL